MGSEMCMRDSARVLGQIEKRGRIARRDACRDRSWFGHVIPSQVTGFTSLVHGTPAMGKESPMYPDFGRP